MTIRTLASLCVLHFVVLLPCSLRAEVPADGWVVWHSNRADAQHDIYLMRADGSEVRRLTQEGGTYPMWSPDGHWIAYRHTADNTVRVIRWDLSESKQVCDGFPVFWLQDGSGVVCGEPNDGFEDGKSLANTYTLVNPDTGESRVLFHRDDFAQVQGGHFIPGGMTRDGRWITAWAFGLFGEGYQADNGFFQSEHASVVLDMNDKSKLYFLGPGCLTATSPFGTKVYHVSRQGPTAPDIFSLDLNDLATRQSYAIELGNPDDDWGHEYFPNISNDNRWLVYGGSNNCHPWFDCDYEIFIHKLGAPPTERTRLTEDPANDGFPTIFVGELWKPGTPISVVDAGAMDGGDSPIDAGILDAPSVTDDTAIASLDATAGVAIETASGDSPATDRPVVEPAPAHKGSGCNMATSTRTRAPIGLLWVVLAWGLRPRRKR
jgi:hypothetical protein